MTKWEHHSKDWEEWQETLPSGKHMSVYRHPERYEYPSEIAAMPGGWVNIKPYKGSRYGDELEKHCLEQHCGWFEINCLMHEMRAKYGQRR